MNPKVSIVMAVYNVEKYIKQSLDSAINQTFKDIEIICIDNNSSDNTVRILKEYAQKDSRITIIENENNLKQGLARNQGIQIAKGEYICFLDGDDWYDLSFVEKLYSKSKKDDSDITICCWLPYDNVSKKLNYSHVYSQLKQISEELNDRAFSWREIAQDSVFWQSSVPWDKMYKKTFLLEKDVKFPDGVFFEDNVFVYDAIFKSEKMSILRKNLVFYRTNRKNAVTNRNNKTFFDYLKIFNLIEENLKKINLYDEMKYAFLNYKIISLYWWYMKIGFIYKREFFNKIKEDFKKIYLTEEEKKLIRNRTLFLMDRFIKLPFFVYLFVFYFDKIYRVEIGKETKTIVWFATFEKWKSITGSWE